MPLVYIGSAIAGILGAGWALGQASDAMDNSAKLAKWGAVAGSVYLAYAAAKKTGAI